MACGATLKRTMDFDPLMSPASPKRRRCVPITAASTSSPQKYLRMEPSPFGEVVSSRLTTGREHFIQNIMLITNYPMVLDVALPDRVICQMDRRLIDMSMMT